MIICLWEAKAGRRKSGEKSGQKGIPQSSLRGQLGVSVWGGPGTVHKEMSLPASTGHPLPGSNITYTLVSHSPWTQRP